MSRWRLALLVVISSAGLRTVLTLSAGHAQESENALRQEIAQVEHQVDGVEADTLAMIAALPPGGSHEPAVLGKALFFDKVLSVN